MKLIDYILVRIQITKIWHWFAVYHAFGGIMFEIQIPFGGALHIFFKKGESSIDYWKRRTVITPYWKTNPFHKPLPPESEWRPAA